MAVNHRPEGTFGLSTVGSRRGNAGATPTGVPPAVTGANIVELNVPQTVSVGGTITITGRVHYNNIARPLTNTPVRVQARAPSMSPITHQTDDLSHCNERPFALDVPAIGQAGQTMNITVVSQSSAAGGWGDNETQGPFTVQILSQEEQLRQSAIGFAPWVVGGGAVGAGAANLTDRDMMTGGLVGAGAGVGAKALAGEGGVGGLIPNLEVDLLQAAALAALLGTGALFISQATGGEGLPVVDDVRSRLPSRS